MASSCFLVLKARCQVVSLSRQGQTRCRGHDVQDVREAFEPCAVHEASRDMAQASAMTQWAECAVAMKGHRQGVRRCCSLTFPHTKKDSIVQSKGADSRTVQTTREPDWGNLASNDERKDDLDEIVRDP